MNVFSSFLASPRPAIERTNANSETCEFDEKANRIYIEMCVDIFFFFRPRARVRVHTVAVQWANKVPIRQIDPSFSMLG